MRTKSVHLLKISPEYFMAVYQGKKKFEVRVNDRDYREGDELILQEYLQQNKRYTGRLFSVTVTYQLEGGQFGILPGYVVLGIELLEGVELNMKEVSMNPYSNLLNEHD